MIAADRTALALLAAGRSTRFGGSKLDADLWGKPLGRHAADMLATLPFLVRLAITGDATLDYAAFGYTVVHNPDPARGQATSLHLAAEHARAIGAEALLIALADMPCITVEHVQHLLDTANGPDAVVASADGSAPKPPALFGSAHFAALLATEGDQGARDLIRAGRLVAADPSELIDIDTREELVRLALKAPSPRP